MMEAKGWALGSRTVLGLAMALLRPIPAPGHFP